MKNSERQQHSQKFIHKHAALESTTEMILGESMRG